MDKHLTIALGVAALTAVLGGPAQADSLHLGINIGTPVPPPVVVVEPPPPRPGPPPWAPAHGRRALHYYRYYPSAQVYFDVERGMYFWFDLGAWQWGPAPPRHLRLGPRYVVLPMEHARPYLYHHQVQRTYPPGWRGGPSGHRGFGRGHD